MKLRAIQLVFFVVLFAIVFGISPCDESTGSSSNIYADQGITPIESFRTVIPDLISKWNIPGGAVALVKDERLVMAEGYGLADKENVHSVTPESLFRIGSISKPITAIAVLKLYEEGLLSLDDKAFEIIDDLQLPGGSVVDTRIYDITIRDLLQHSGGWDPEVSLFYPMFRSQEIAEAMGVQAPANAETIIRFMMDQPLDFTPGTRYAYSNFGYCVLGRIIERVTGESYEDFVKTQVLKPIGITQMCIGHTLLKDRMYREVHYYDYPGAPLVQSVFPEIKELVPQPYGGFYQEALDSCGGWIASIIDLMRFITSVDGHNVRSDILKSSTIKLMVSRPELSDWENTASYYGMGWHVRPVGDEANWWHEGGIPGTICFIVRFYSGIAYVALFNSRPFNTSSFIYEFYNALDHAINGITEWPSYDLFENYPTEYTLLISSTLGGGTSPSTGTYTYPSGTHVQITAISDTGYRFTGWTGDFPSGHENDNPITITMDSYKSITANFTKVPTNGDKDEKGGCFIATACYGTPMAEEVRALCAFRDKYLFKNPLGRGFIKFYYKYSPEVADFIRDKEVIKGIIRECLRPFIWIISKFVHEAIGSQAFNLASRCGKMTS